MLRGMLQLATKSDVLRVVIALLACLALWGIVAALVHSNGARVAGPVIFGVIFLAVFVSTVLSLHVRAKKLLAGRCPNSMCHGTVHHSERLRRGQLLCPTCGSKWPEIKGIRFRATGREHA